MKDKEIEEFINKIEKNSYYPLNINKYFYTFGEDIAKEVTIHGKEIVNILTKNIKQI